MSCGVYLKSSPSFGCGEGQGTVEIVGPGGAKLHQPSYIDNQISNYQCKLMVEQLLKALKVKNFLPASPLCSNPHHHRLVHFSLQKKTSRAMSLEAFFEKKIKNWARTSVPGTFWKKKIKKERKEIKLGDVKLYGWYSLQPDTTSLYDFF